MFYGNLQCSIANSTWPRIQIVDLASNNFSGDLLPQYISNWEGMVGSSNYDNLHFEVVWFNKAYYQDTVTLTLKGRPVVIVKISAVYKSIDLSGNNFHGDIPDILGDFRSFYLLKISHNSLTGKIPTALGSLTQLESLDLSTNQLSGRIPNELVNLTFLCVMNLSVNQLSGRIPRGKQLDTFSEDSYRGNTGQCGFSLKTTCTVTKEDELLQPTSHPKHEIDGEYISFALGSCLTFGIVIWLLLNSQRYNERVDRALFRTFGEMLGRSFQDNILWEEKQKKVRREQFFSVEQQKR
ncbi:putative receptor like protein 25 [Lycium barbarum]|uniref:putative receptor like protein 25 n=1 Tax=Lycium barbarum TaxID=112863 RepID=UPI00293E8885|nr:putative receptor like protein 25 [Lycium barbarum]